MYLEKRPTSITVIGWAWIVIGGLMLISSVPALFMSVSLNSDPSFQEQEDIPFVFRYFVYFAFLQCLFSVVGIISGVNLLKMKLWARNALEILSWILLVSLVFFLIYWSINWLSFQEEIPDDSSSYIGLIMAIMITSIYGVPLIIMIRKLRSKLFKDVFTTSN